jgi:pyruvate,orthophosphate dikinase
VQAMVFGNLDDKSGTGVVFTRNPITGQAELYGEWLPKSQGEDVVSGRCRPRGVADLNLSMPDIYMQLLDAARLLERTMCDVQDIEFTIESGKLWLLQTRSAKRSAAAAVRHAVNLVQEGIITSDMALNMISPDQLRAFLQPHLAPHARATVLAKGAVASPGVASGLVVDSADEAEELAEKGVDVILARPTTDPNDVHGIIAAQAVITEIGGATSHAALVSRELHRVCVVGCGVGSLTPLTGKHVTVDATNGEILDGVLDVETPSKDTDPVLQVLARWLEDAGDDPKHRPLKSIVLGRRC